MRTPAVASHRPRARPSTVPGPGRPGRAPSRSCRPPLPRTRRDPGARRGPLPGALETAPSRGCVLRAGVVPAAVRCDERVSRFGTPAAGLVGASAGMRLEDAIDHGPGGLHGVFASEQGAVAGHRIAQEPFVRGFLSRLLFDQIELSLVTHVLLPGALYAGGEGHRRVGRKLEAQIVGATVHRRGVLEETLRWRLELDQNLGAVLGQQLTGAQVPGHALP